MNESNRIPTLVVCSGGLDSVTLAHRVAASETHRVSRLLGVDYGQRHVKELDFAAACAERLEVPHHVVDLRSLTALLPGSSLTDGGVEVPEGHYAEDSMKATVVPNRNPILLTVAYGVASAHEDGAVAAAVHGGDHFIYPDCRPGFARAFAAMEAEALEGMTIPELLTPYLHLTKTDIGRDAARFEAPIEMTWSCYQGGNIHCGRCGTCVERLEALHDAGTPDPTDYADPDYWKEAVANAKVTGATAGEGGS